MDIQADPRITHSISFETQQSITPDKAKNLKQLRESTREFEAMYLNEVYKSMRKNVPDNGIIKKSFATKMYQEMLDMEMARTAASGKGIGLGEAMFNQLKEHVK